MQDIEQLTDRVLRTLEGDAAVDPTALTFLIRRYGTSDREDLGGVIERGLASAIADKPWTAETGDRRYAWLAFCAEAAAVCDDPRLPEAALELVSNVRRDWPIKTSVDEATRSIGACLVAIDVFQSRALVQPAIDALERVVGHAYQPGEGMSEDVGGSAPGTRLSDQVSSASALLAAYGITARLPYSMLAEELIRFALRTMWDEQEGGFFAAADRRDPQKPFAANCDTARVLCRLAALHLDGSYRDAAVTAPDSDYARDAARTLASQEGRLQHGGVDAALYGLALAEWLGLQSHGHLWPSTDPF